MKLQPQLRTYIYISLPMREITHHPSKKLFYSTGICARYIFQATCHNSSAARLLARRVSQEYWYVSDLACLMILYVFATKSPPTRGGTCQNYTAMC